MTTATQPQFPFQDAALSVEQRTEDLVSRMSIEDKVGMFFQTMVAFGSTDEGAPAFGIPSLRSMIERRHMSHFNVTGGADTAREFAAWQNAAQRIAQETGLGIPITFSSDPRHAFTDNPATSMLAGPFSQWPETLGLAAVRSAELVGEYADVVRREYLAVGLRLALHPQIDLATEPRWARANGTFGEDADLTAELGAAYIRGMQGSELSSESVSTMTKHFPGGGPQKDGEDPHFPYGREQVYPAGQFDLHLKPFKAAIAVGAAQMMPYYGMPMGTEYEEVGFGFNRGILTDLLRNELGFTGIVCTDWGLLTDADILGTPMPARAWGVEHLSRSERMVKALEAGVDQFGGELCTDVLLELVRSGQVTENRLDISVRRLVAEKFRLGLFDNPFVDEDRAELIVGSDEHRAAGEDAQSRSVTVLTNAAGSEASAGSAGDGPTLPLGRGRKIYVEGLRLEAVAEFATVVADVADADVAILRMQAPFEQRGGGFEAFFHAGSLEFPQEEVDRILAIARAVPTVLDVYLDRPAILTPFLDEVAALTVDFGVSHRALLRALFGDRAPEGSLPFDLPRSMAAVEASRSDAPFDTVDPVFQFGHGLRIG